MSSSKRNNWSLILDLKSVRSSIEEIQIRMEADEETKECLIKKLIFIEFSYFGRAHPSMETRHIKFLLKIFPHFTFVHLPKSIRLWNLFHTQTSPCCLLSLSLRAVFIRSPIYLRSKNEKFLEPMGARNYIWCSSKWSSHQCDAGLWDKLLSWRIRIFFADLNAQHSCAVKVNWIDICVDEDPLETKNCS